MSGCVPARGAVGGRAAPARIAAPGARRLGGAGGGQRYGAAPAVGRRSPPPAPVHWLLAAAGSSMFVVGSGRRSQALSSSRRSPAPAPLSSPGPPPGAGAGPSRVARCPRGAGRERGTRPRGSGRSAGRVQAAALPAERRTRGRAGCAGPPSGRAGAGPGGRRRQQSRWCGRRRRGWGRPDVGAGRPVGRRRGDLLRGAASGGGGDESGQCELPEQPPAAVSAGSGRAGAGLPSSSSSFSSFSSSFPPSSPRSDARLRLWRLSAASGRGAAPGAAALDLHLMSAAPGPSLAGGTGRPPLPAAAVPCPAGRARRLRAPGDARRCAPTAAALLPEQQPAGPRFSARRSAADAGPEPSAQTFQSIVTRRRRAPANHPLLLSSPVPPLFFFFFLLFPPSVFCFRR